MVILDPAIGADVAGDQPTLAVYPPVTQLGESVTIMGSGFNPGDTIYLVIDIGGSLTDIEYELDGEASPVVNDNGAFVIAWIPDRIHSRIIASGRGGPGAGAYTLMATNTDYIALTTTPMAIWEEVDEGESLPAWVR